MLIEEINVLAKESKNLEYKEMLSKSYLKTVSAYANFNDGVIVFGVTDDLKVVGLEDPNSVCLDIENQINDSIRPKPDFSLKVNDDKTVVLAVFKGLNTPYRYNGKCYKRNDTSTVEVDPLTENRLVLEGMNVHYEELPAKNQKLSFSFLGEKLKEALNLSEFNTDTLKSLNLFNKQGYNVAAELLADSNDFLGLDIVVFGNNINEFKKRYVLDSQSLLKQYFEALKIFEDEYVIEKIDGGLRQRYELIPYEAFREVLANSIIHRTWDVKSSTKIEMHKDKIVVSSPGGLMPEMSKEAFLKGRFSYLRNPILANVFHRLNIVEVFATGIKRTFESYEGFQDKPSFDVTDSYVCVTLPIKNEITLAKCEQALLDKMSANGDYLRTDLERMTGFSKDKVIRVLNSLIEKNLIIKTGNSRNTYYRKANG